MKKRAVPTPCITAAPQNAAEYDIYSRRNPPIIIPMPMPISHAVNMEELAVPLWSLRASLINIFRKAGYICPLPRPMRAAAV